MTSAIITDTLDENFPVAGQDNDSQGFRDNFNVIKNALSTAASEITVLQNTTAKLGTEENNNFLGGIISNVQLSNAYKIRATGEIVDNTVNVTEAYYFVLTKVENTPITINWPDNQDPVNCIEIVLEVVAPDTNTGPVNVSFIDSRTNFGNSLTLAVGEVAVFKCWLSDSDSTKATVQLLDKFQ